MINDDKGALEEACRRWGKSGAIKLRADLTDARRCTVGKIVLGSLFEVMGQGATWKNAFAAADQYELDEKARYARLRAQA